MKRVNDERLKELRENGITVYSISRIDSINNCLYGAYRTYDLHEKGAPNIYSSAGSVTHDCLEKIMNNEATETDLLPCIQEELDNLDLLNIEFPKDRNGRDSIREGWIADMTHFASTYKKPTGNFKTEELFIYKTKGGHYLQGYIDLQRINKDGSIDIYDYKTSSMYRGEEIKKHGRQLLVYCAGLKQDGYKVNSVAWIMLKYAEIKFMGKKTAKSKEKTEISKVCERRKIGEEMSKYVERDLIDAGYDEIDIEIILKKFCETNMFDCLPEKIASNYKMLPYVMKYDITPEFLDECEEYIDSTIEMWESLNHDNDKDFKPKSFTKVQKNGKEVEDIFFCTSLCDHKNNCPYLLDYLAIKESDVEDEYYDLF